MTQAYKIVVYVPATHGEALRQAIGDAGAGRIGNYTHCTFTSTGFGRFKPGPGAKPVVGEHDRVNVVPEERVETVCPPALLKSVIDEIRRVHPYEEPAFDVYPIEVVE
jgi:hypothetical protein